MRISARAEDAGERLDIFLTRQMLDWSRSQVQRLIRSGLVTVGARVALKGGEEVQAGDTISVRAEREELTAMPEALPLSIVYEDEDLLVVNKPAGMAVHVGAGVKSGTLVNALLHHVKTLSSAGGEMRPGIVHRLDRMTSGLVMVAKNDAAHRQLAEQFKSREVRKTYVLLVHGRVASEQGEICKPVGRDPIRRTRMKAGDCARGRRSPATRSSAGSPVSRWSRPTPKLAERTRSGSTSPRSGTPSSATQLTAHPASSRSGAGKWRPFRGPFSTPVSWSFDTRGRAEPSASRRRFLPNWKNSSPHFQCEGDYGKWAFTE